MIHEELYSQIVQVMPIPCVDLIVSDERGRILLLRRGNEPAKGQWWFPGGRVYHGETRGAAVARKLKEECGLEPTTIEEIGTFDVMLEIPGHKEVSHGITTLFHAAVGQHVSIRLDTQSADADWRTLDDWLKEPVSDFVRTNLLKYRLRSGADLGRNG